MNSTAHTVTTTRSLVITSDNITRTVYLHVMGNGTVYIGGSDVTAAQGFPIVKHTAPIQGGLGVGEGLWGICASGQTETIRIITIDAD